MHISHRAASSAKWASISVDDLTQSARVTSRQSIQTLADVVLASDISPESLNYTNSEREREQERPNRSKPSPRDVGALTPLPASIPTSRPTGHLSPLSSRDASTSQAQPGPRRQRHARVAAMVPCVCGGHHLGQAAQAPDLRRPTSCGSHSPAANLFRTLDEAESKWRSEAACRQVGAGL
ncbi:hypothetical protein CMUS01_05188 [Colletotrichum musicola]|uniref:Uncharacterized protein n=1 Tax=Colletotrichum musicola TaxID=2175873 RepID=A0A8H6KSS8_9PEZI|nr:hypothetical protein CMUS01_05188 [Colletotrichum musicola]